MMTEAKAKSVAIGMTPPRGCAWPAVLLSAAWLWSVLDQTHRLPAGGEGKPGARARAEQWMATHAAHETSAPVLVIGHGGRLALFDDGRHRWHVLREAGAEWIICCVHPMVARWAGAEGHARPYEIGGHLCALS